MLIVIQGAAKYVMIVFFSIGMMFVGFSMWALYATEIPQEQFLEDPRFEEDYVRYYQVLSVFGIILVSAGAIFAFIGRKMSQNQGSRLSEIDISKKHKEVLP